MVPVGGGMTLHFDIYAGLKDLSSKAQKILDVLKKEPGPVTTAGLVEAAEIPRSTLQRELRILRDRALIVQGKHGLTDIWSFPMSQETCPDDLGQIGPGRQSPAEGAQALPSEKPQVNE
jgi:hypothetical protein